MTPKTRIRIAQVMGATAIVASVIGLIWLVLLGRADELWENWVFHNAIIGAGSGVIAWVVAPRQPDNSETWVFAWAGVLTGLECFAYAASSQVLESLGRTHPVLETVPASLPVTAGILFMVTNFLWVGIFLPFTFGLLLFPDGRLPSQRWRPVLWALSGILAVQSAGLLWRALPSSTLTLAAVQDTHGGFETLGASMVTVGYLGVFAMVPFCVAALIVRFRRSRGIERQQFRWVAWGAAVAGAGMVTAVILDEAADRLDLALVAGAVAMAVLLTSFGIAITRYRLYDVDIVISRSVVYGTLAVFITSAYVAVVVGVGGLIHVDSNSPLLAITATAVVAAAVQPLRRRMQRVANRIAYGRRATPYEV
ncbi:MAG: hypothetical protein R3246_10590, partial [Acidimicrobiia bacterium]|nr:hypothetical protein [Acidimicrobiia bacterium]